MAERRMFHSAVGSEGSAARGRRSDLSEWPRSAGDAGVRAKETAGHRNRTYNEEV